jgi:hypothetical protein
VLFNAICFSSGESPVGLDEERMHDFVSTVGLDEEVVRKYIREQEDRDDKQRKLFD